ncbi:MAG: sugar-binding transcriptional regulator [Leucobacter sp.]
MYISSARIAHMYYEEGLTQQKIANVLGISRIRVSRLLQQARDEGVVRISINYDGYYGDLEKRLAQLYPGLEVIVADGLDGSEEQRKAATAAAAAQFLDVNVRAGVTVALGWGQTLLGVANRMTPSDAGGTFVPMIAGQGFAALEVHAAQLADRMARLTSGDARHLLAPAIASTAEERDVILKTPGVAETLAVAERAQIAVFSVGAPFAPGATLPQTGYLTAEDIELLRTEDARCDIISLAYLNGNGDSCAEELADRAIAISREALSQIPRKVLVVHGEEKSEAITLTLRAGFADTLVTDHRTATSLIALAEGQVG